MLKIKLSKREKAVLSAIQNGNTELPYSEESRRAIIRSLADKGLVKAIITKGNSSGLLSDLGYLLFEENPKLRNPVDWKTIHLWITTIIAILALIKP